MLKRFRPAVSRRFLLLLAGLVWIGVGGMLLSFAAHWLNEQRGGHLNLLVAIGVAAAMVIHHLGFLRIVDRNLGRLQAMEGKRCAFSFISLRSYLMIALMMGLGALLRHSPLPKPYIAVLYIGIGLALILSSVRYLRVLLFPPTP